MKYLLLQVLGLLIITSGFAQVSISGKIRDKETNEPLSYANIYLPELHKGTTTDDVGDYVLSNLPTGFITIQYSYVGFETILRQVNVSKGNFQIDIELTPSAITSQEVVISAKAYSAQDENAIKIETVNLNSLQQPGSISVLHRLSQVPGVDIISKGPGITTPTIRGLSTTNILALNNGIRMENFQFSENHPYLIDEAGVETVEVIKGPASLLYGSDAIGGALNFIKERPASTNTIQGDVYSAIISNTKGINAGAGVKGTQEDFFWGLRANVKSNKDYLDGAGQTVPNARFNEASAKFFTGLSRNIGSFKVFYDYNEMKLGLTHAISINEVTDNNRQNNIWYQHLHNHLLATKNKFFFGNWQIDANISYQHNSRQLKASENTPEFIMTDMRLQTITYELTSNYIFAEDKSLIVGYQGLYQQNRNQDAPDHVLPDYQLSDNSFYVLYKSNFSKKTYYQVGTRYDFRSIFVPADENNAEPFQNTYGNLSGSLGVTHKITKPFLLRANLASAYRTPNVAELTQDGVHGTRYELGNKSLESQRNYEGDLSLHYHGNKIMFDVAGFYNRINNYIYLMPTAATTPEGLEIFKYTQSDARIYGYETGTELLLLKWLNLKINYAYLIGQQDDGNYLPLIPQNKIRTSLTFSKQDWAGFDNLYFNVGAVIAFRQQNPSMFETSTLGYEVFNLSSGGSIKLNKQRVNINLTLNNVFNQAFMDHLSTLKRLGYYNLGRNWILKVKFPFQLNKK